LLEIIKAAQASSVVQLKESRMHNPLFWIEWLDRLDRVLNSARQDVAVLKRALSPRTLEAIDRSKRQLAALLNDLRLLDRDVLTAGTTPSAADALQAALEMTVGQLGSLAAIPAASAPGVLDRMLASSDAALRDSCYEAATLLAPDRRRVSRAEQGATL
jgi:N-acetylglutamate synthase-like GNAT family acetyltransferase